MNKFNLPPWATPFLVSLIFLSSCSVRGTYYPVGDGYPPREQPAEITALSDAELQTQGYERIGVLIRAWNPQDEETRLPTELRFVRAEGLPSTSIFEPGFLRSIRRQAGVAGGDLIRREPNLAYEQTVTMPAVNVAGSEWVETTRTLDYQRLSWSVWRLTE